VGGDGGKAIYTYNVFVDFASNGKIKELKALGRVQQFNYKGELQMQSYFVASGVDQLPDYLKEFVSMVENFRSGEYIGDQRSVLLKYKDFILSPDPDAKDMFGDYIHPRNMLKCDCAVHR
jgi:hypothetical protein